MNRAEIIAANPITEFLRSRGHELKRFGENFVTSGCPVTQHKNGHRPVTVYPRTQSWSCHDCKKSGSVIDWLMCEKNITAGDVMRELSGGPNGADAKTKRLIEATYDYHDEEGTLVHRTVRYLTKKGEKKKFAQCRPDGKGGWIWNLKGIEPVLFRLPEITKDIHAGKPIFLAEGEKDVLSMVEHGLSATCNPMGAGKWRDSYSQTLRGAGVTIIADKDQSGREHAQLVASKIHGIAKSVRVIELPDLNQKSVKDASDYFAAGGDVEQLVALADSAPEWTPSTDSEYPEGVPLVTLAERDIDPENNLLGNRYLCIGGIMFFVGPSGIGKSSVSAQQDISWSLGWPAFHIRPARPLRILCIQAENDLDDLTEMAAGVCKGLNLTPEQREIVRRNVIYVSDCSHTGEQFLRMLEHYLKKHAPMDLVRIDTFIAYLGGDLLSVEITSKFLRNGLNSILRKFHCAAIINHHTPKPTNIDRSHWRPMDWMYFGAGNADLTNAPRATMSMDSTHAPDVFEFRAGKRGKRIGWIDEKGEPVLVRYFCWSKGETIFWRDASDEDIELVKSSQPQRSRSAQNTATIEDLFNLIPPTGSIEKNILLQAAAEKSRGEKLIGLNRGRIYLTQLIDEKRAFEWRIKRRKTNDRIEISRHEQTLI